MDANTEDKISKRSKKSKYDISKGRGIALKIMKLK